MTEGLKNSYHLPDLVVLDVLWLFLSVQEWRELVQREKEGEAVERRPVQEAAVVEGRRTGRIKMGTQRHIIIILLFISV